MRGSAAASGSAHGGPTRAVVFASLLMVSQAFAAAQAPAPHTSWGVPDLQGVWDTRTMTPLERPEQFSDQAFLTDEQAAEYERQTIARRNDDDLNHSVHAKFWLDYGTQLYADKRTSLIVDPSNGRVPPLTQAGEGRADARRAARSGRGPADSWEDRTLWERCVTRGLPTVMLPAPYNGYVRILQTSDVVVIFTEMIHEARVVPMDGRPRLPAELRQWLGDSRGRWEGDTLVVETTNFMDRTIFRGSGENLHLVERFTRLDSNTLRYEFTVTDQQTWPQAWSVAFPITKAEGHIYEYACHEGNHALRNMLTYARSEELGSAK
jgi:hypothetical protein